MSHLKIGVLGAAKIAQRFMLDAIKNTKDCELYAIASRDNEKARELASKYDMTVFNSYKELIDCKEINVVYIPLPNGLHYKWAKAALENGKHVLCEKSLTGNLNNSLELINLAAQKNVVIAENFMCSEHNQNILVRDLIKKNEIGELKFINMSFGFPALPENDIRYDLSLEGGALNDAGAYTVFMGSFFAQSKVEMVVATLNNRSKKVDVDGSIFIKYENGVIGNYNFGFDCDYKNSAHFWGNKGQIDINRVFSIPPDFKPEINKVINNEKVKIEALAENHFENFLSKFILSIKNKDTEYFKGRITEQALLLEAVRVSANEKRAVNKNEIDLWRKN